MGDPAASRAVSTARSFLDSLGDDAVERPSPDLPAALGGIGGLFLGLGIVVLVGQSGGRGVIVLGGLVALAAAYLVAFFALERVPFLRTPAVSMTVVAIFAIAIGLLIGDEGDLTSDRAASVAILLGGVACLGAWIAPGLRGRPFLLGTGLVAVPFGVAGLLAGGEPCEGFECSAFEETAGTTGLNTVSAIVLCLVGGALLALVWKLDEWGKAGLATTVAAACILNLGLGAVGLAADLGDTGGASLIAIAGSALGIVGHLRARRGLTWTGAALAGGSLAYVVIDTANPGSGTGAGFVLVLTGVIVAGTPRLVMLIRDSESNRPGGPPPES